MRTTSITLCLVLASFGVSAKILDLTYQVKRVPRCTWNLKVKRLEAGMKSPNNPPPHGVWTRAWCRPQLTH
jgi:hypothetical protein